MKTSKLDHMSQGKRREIAEMYGDKNIPVREILETYKIDYRILYACTEEFGIPYRDEKKEENAQTSNLIDAQNVKRVFPLWKQDIVRIVEQIWQPKKICCLTILVLFGCGYLNRWVLILLKIHAK